MRKGPVTAIIVGAGNRAANVYAPYALSNPDKLRIVGVADPIAHRRERTAARYSLTKEQCFESADDLATRGKLADAVINGTMDAEHVPTSLPLLEVGYDMLLEKPFAVTEEEVRTLAKAVRKHKRKMMICHVLRYTPFYSAIFNKLASGEIGEVVNLQMTEHVSYHHMSAAFIRGKWGNEKECGSPILLAKTCHDFDMLMWLKTGVRPTKVSSFGGLHYFKPEKAPPGSGTQCVVDCKIEKDCPFSARKHYIDMDLWLQYAWRGLEHIKDPTKEQKLEHLKDKNNPFGRCVWHAGNDVCDRQSAIVEFTDGATASFDLVGGVSHPMRKIHVIGTKGEIRGIFEDGKFVVEKMDARPGHEFTTEEVNVNISVGVSDDFGGHGGGDARITVDFVNMVRGEPTSPSCTSIDDSMNGHLAVFAAERARKQGQVVDIPTA